MDNFNLQKFVKKSKNEFYTNLYEGKKKHSMEEEMHDDDHKMDKTLNEGVDLKHLMKGDKVNNDVLVVMATSYKNEDDARSKAMRPKAIEDNSKNAGPGAKIMRFADLAGGPDKMMKIEDDKVVDIRLFSDWDNMNEEKMHDDNHKMEENHQSLDPEVADRIEGLLNIPMKAKFLSVGHDLINDFLEDEAMDVEDIVSHLANELEKHYKASATPPTSAIMEEDEVEVEDEVEDEVEVEAPEMDLDLEAPTEEPDNKEVFSQLVDAYEAAKELGDEKLTRQLANTITYFNKTIIFGDEE